MIIDEDLERDEILLPSMLLQPYVENALWHGLMHKDGERKMKITFKRISDEIFRCTIDDNGIGRKKAAELTSKSATKHKSMGLKITANRIAIMQNTNESTVNINDLVDADGNAAGTEVIIKLPVIYD